MNLKNSTVNENGEFFEDNKKVDTFSYFGYNGVHVDGYGKARVDYCILAKLYKNCELPEDKSLWRVIHVDGDKTNDSVSNLRLVDEDGVRFGAPRKNRRGKIVILADLLSYRITFEDVPTISKMFNVLPETVWNWAKKSKIVDGKYMITYYIEDIWDELI